MVLLVKNMESKHPKKEAKEFINDIKSGKKTYNEFDKWLDKTNN